MAYHLWGPERLRRQVCMMRFVHPCFDGLVQTAIEYWLRELPNDRTSRRARGHPPCRALFTENFLAWVPS